MRHAFRNCFAGRALGVRARCRPAPRAILLLLTIPLLFTTCKRVPSESKRVTSPESTSDTAAYLVGRYELIGRVPDGTAPFVGTVSLLADGDAFRIDRTIGDETVSGRAWIEASRADRVEVLRARFKMSGQEYKATYLWRSDLDNYPLLSGRVYRSGTQSPGLEAWFPIPAD